MLTSYVVAAAVMAAPVGWLANRFGIKTLLLTCVTGFTLASMLYGIAQNIEEIVLFRVLQGTCGAALVPLAQSVMLGIYPPQRRGWAMSLFGMGVMIGPIMGPCSAAGSRNTTPGAGFSTSTCRSASPPLSDSWPSWTIPRPTGRFTLRLAGLCRVRRHHRRVAADARPRAIGLVRLGEIVLMAIVSATAFYFFIAHSLTTERPFIPIDVFRDRNHRRPDLHVRHRHPAGGKHGADGAPAAGRDGLSDPRCRDHARNPRARHGRHHAGGRPAVSASMGGSCCLRASRAASYPTLLLDRLPPDTTMRTIVWVSILQGRGSASCSCR